MHAVPEIVQNVDIAAHQQKCQHQHRGHLFPNPNLSGTQEWPDQHQRQHTARQIGQAVLAGRLVIADEIGEEIPPVLVELPARGKNIIHTVGQLQCQIGGDQQHCRQSAAQQRRHKHHQRSASQMPWFEIEHTQARIRQHSEDAGEHADVEIREQGQPQRNDIEPVFAVPHQLHHSQYHQRQKCHRIHPDDVPVVAKQIAAQGVHH